MGQVELQGPRRHHRLDRAHVLAQRHRRLARHALADQPQLRLRHDRLELRHHEHHAHHVHPVHHEHHVRRGCLG